MHDFSSPYRNVAYFGSWGEETADVFGKRDALNVLKMAVENCVESDMRTPEVLGAVAFLERTATRDWEFKQFRLGLDCHDPINRRIRLHRAFNGILKITGDLNVYNTNR